MQNERISFDAMPEMLAAIAQKLESIETKVDNLTIPSNNEEKDEWLNLKGLCDSGELSAYPKTSLGNHPDHAFFTQIRIGLLRYTILSVSLNMRGQPIY